MPLTPDQREFVTFPRGELRRTILEQYRLRLRGLTNPDTNAPFTEAEAQAATSELTKEYVEAEALDFIGLAQQQRGLWLSDQALPTTASDRWLKDFHAIMWDTQQLPASSGGGAITWVAVPGTVFIGSSVFPDPLAAKIAIGAVTYQVTATTFTPANGIAELEVRALSTGRETNAPAGSKATVVTGPPGASIGESAITIPVAFQGGAPVESASDFGRRILSLVRYKQGGGNPPQLRAWTRRASSAIEDAWVYSCALHAGSTIIAITTKPGDSESPTARISGPTEINAAVAYMVPPGSPVVPWPPFMLIVGCTSQPIDMMVRLQLPRRTLIGWSDLAPWPAPETAPTVITTVTTQTSFRIDTIVSAGTLPSAIPSLMVWDTARSKFELLAVQSVTLFAGTVYDVVLSSAPTTTLAAGMLISPDSGRRDEMTAGARAFFHSLGPGELVDLQTSVLAHRAERFPPGDEEWNARAGNGILAYLRDALGQSATDDDLVYTSGGAVPLIPADPADGPRLVTVKGFSVYPM